MWPRLVLEEQCSSAPRRWALAAPAASRAAAIPADALTESHGPEGALGSQQELIPHKPLTLLTLLKGLWSMQPFPDLEHGFLEYLWYLLKKQRPWLLLLLLEPF